MNTQGSLSSGTCFSLYMTHPSAFFFFLLFLAVPHGLWDLLQSKCRELTA